MKCPASILTPFFFFFPHVIQVYLSLFLMKSENKLHALVFLSCAATLRNFFPRILAVFLIYFFNIGRYLPVVPCFSPAVRTLKGLSTSCGDIKLIVALLTDELRED